MAPTLPVDRTAKALESGTGTRAARRRKEKLAARGKLVKVKATGELYSPGRRKKREVCRRLGISGKRYRALERKHRREWRGVKP